MRCRRCLAGIALDIPVVTLQAALNAMPPVPGRLEMARGSQPFGVYVDYAHTDDALKNVLETLREITSGRLLLTFGCGGNRDAGKRARMGKAQAGDTVLIAGKGHETYQEFEDTVVPFDDRLHAQEALESLGYGKAKG